MSQATLTLLQVQFVGNGPCSGPPLEFRVGTNSIGSAEITQPSSPVSFTPGSSGMIGGTCSIRAYQNGALRAQFSPGLNASTSQTNAQSQAMTAIFGGGKLYINYNVTPIT